MDLKCFIYVYGSVNHNRNIDVFVKYQTFWGLSCYFGVIVIFHLGDLHNLKLQLKQKVCEFWEYAGSECMV